MLKGTHAQRISDCSLAGLVSILSARRRARTAYENKIGKPCRACLLGPPPKANLEIGGDVAGFGNKY